jgi:uncharacterized protein (DUF302 family)
MTTTSRRVPFTGVRIVREIPKPYDAVLASLGAQMGQASIPEVVALAASAPDEAAYAREVGARFAGPSGFMRFAEIDHGGWISRFGIERRTVRWIFGNPAIAITMIRHDITAGLFVPIELLVTEAETREGVTLTYVLPSSLIAIDPANVELKRAAEALDDKVAALIEAVVAD